MGVRKRYKYVLKAASVGCMETPMIYGTCLYEGPVLDKGSGEPLFAEQEMFLSERDLLVERLIKMRAKPPFYKFPPPGAFGSTFAGQARKDNSSPATAWNFCSSLTRGICRGKRLTHGCKELLLQLGD